jgi:Ca2+-binding RTX toxin-like protein
VLLYIDDASGGEAEGDELNNIENVTGSAYADLLWGDDNVNVLRGMNGADVLKGFGGNDHLFGGNGGDTLEGGDGGDFLYGDAGADTLRGQDGNDYLDGGGGVDQMSGGAGNDRYIIDQAGDAVTEAGGQGTDEVRANVSYTLTAGADVELLRTTNDAGVVNINLTGNATGNVVRGNDGNNTINGGDGNDELIGLGGTDRFLFDTALNAATNVDVLSDFTVGADTIVLENTIFGAFAAGPLADDRFVLGTAPLDGNDNILYDAATGALYYDSDGNGGAAAVQFAEVTPGLALTHEDFAIV